MTLTLLTPFYHFKVIINAYFPFATNMVERLPIIPGCPNATGLLRYCSVIERNGFSCGCAIIWVALYGVNAEEYGKWGHLFGGRYEHLHMPSSHST